MKIGIVTRGYDQQLDYNVISRRQPFGEEVHLRMSALGRKKTSINDFNFSFVVYGDGTKWEVLINCIRSGRKDFTGSALRTYLYMAGACGDDADATLAQRILLSEIVAYCPRCVEDHLTQLGQALDRVLTDEAVRSLAEWNGAARIDVNQWVSCLLIPSLMDAFHEDVGSEALNSKVPDFVVAVESVFLGSKQGTVTGEYLPYLVDGDAKEPNLTLHYSSEVRIRGNGTVEKKEMGGGCPQPPPPMTLVKADSDGVPHDRIERNVLFHRCVNNRILIVGALGILLAVVVTCFMRSCQSSVRVGKVTTSMTTMTNGTHSVNEGRDK